LNVSNASKQHTAILTNIETMENIFQK